MNPPNLHYTDCCGTCGFSECNYEGEIHCIKFKQWLEVELICDEYEE